MFGGQGKQFAGFVSQHVEGMLADHLGKKAGKNTTGERVMSSRGYLCIGYKQQFNSMVRPPYFLSRLEC